MPTAVQEVAEVQDTPFRAFPAEPDGLGVLWIFQDGLAAGEPSARSHPGGGVGGPSQHEDTADS